jgi:GAF domain-containing protein
VTHSAAGPENQPAIPAAAVAATPQASVSDEDRFENLVVRLHEASDTQQTVDTLLAFAVEHLACDHATVALRRRTGIHAAAASDEASLAALRAQLEVGEGPCVTAIRTGLSVLIPDTAVETRWPDWTREVSSRGRSIFSIPLTVGGTTLGVLSLIGEHPHRFDAGDIGAARLATYGAVAIASIQHRESLRHAVESGQRIGQAIGILRERFSIDESQAFAVLKRHSQDTNTKLRDIAEQLIETGRLPS